MWVRRRILTLHLAQEGKRLAGAEPPALAMKARISFGKHPPPKPIPALRNLRPIRASWPIASANTETSAPVTSHTSAIALMNEIFVAKKAFAES